jgi:hypothetical protein
MCGAYGFSAKDAKEVYNRFDIVNTLEGSGSLEQDGSFCIVAMEEEEQARLMHDHRLGKGQRHAHKTGQTLP